MSQTAVAPQPLAQAAPEVRALGSAEDFIEWRRQACEAAEDSRKLAERDEDYYNNVQLTAAEIKTLNRRGQPTGTFNMIRRKVDYILGAEKQTRTDPKCFPRTPNETEAAEAFTDALRYAADRSRFQMVKSAVAKNLLINGYGGCYVGVTKTKDGKIDITHTLIPWDRLWHDPHSRELDFEDARYVGWDTWYDEDEANKKFPQGGDALAVTWSKDDEHGREDKPSWSVWSDTKRKRVRVSEIIYRDDGVWHRACFTLGGEVEPAQPVTYLDENGEPECPVVLASAYVDRECARHGMVRDLVPIQDEINKRRQKALHLITMRQVRVARGASLDPKAVSRTMAQPDGVIVADKDDFEILPTNDMAAANLGMLQEAKAEMSMAGPNAAMQGKDPRSLSGRAIQAQQQGGLTELAPILDSLRDWQMRVMRQTKNRIRQFWTDEMWIRVTDDERNVRFVGLNVPITAGEAMIEKAKASGQEIPPEMLQQIAADPRAQQVVGTRNNIAATDVDLIIDEQPDVVTLQAETFESLGKMVAAGLPIPPDVVLESAPLPSKTKRLIMDKLEEAAKAPPKLDPAIEAKAMETKAKIEADAAKMQADMQMKALEIEMKREEMQFRRIEMEFELQKLQMQNAQQAQQIAAQREVKQIEREDKAAERGSAEMQAGVPVLAGMVEQMAASSQNQAQMIAAAFEQLGRALTAPKTLVRGPDGRALGVQTVQ